MSRISTLEPADAPQSIAGLYDAVNKKLGLVPNMVKTLGHSNAALQGYLGFSGAVSSGRLSPSTREKLALLVAERNGCDYCLSAHTAISGLLKIPAQDVQAAREGKSPIRKEQAILDLAAEILANKGVVSDEVYADAIAQGVTPEEALEVVANVAVNILTNYVNNFAEPEIDFPRVAVSAA
ncbi:carboxymuconolactone decarboxylase family protein [Cerasicoccus maritimus]|uniref:carboxymuconolactone decarboxylase family protein n=1 Tax=Cerasicoccus maritimus TaxID=490089 RepID=UPI0028524A3A|nr:carboxymuconolactone decarboxylase family protein [Cerasicoccus maritimus]